MTQSLASSTLDAIVRLNNSEFQQIADPETQTRIAQYEMAFRMQTAVPELADISSEPRHVLELYGPDVHTPGTFARCCLLARRLAERDVRFVQIFHRGWDQHGNLAGDLPRQCKDVDQATFALVTDLKQRGLLDDTLVIWGGEFGRTIYCQGGSPAITTGATITPSASHSGWQAPGSSPASSTARPTISATTSSPTRYTFTT